MIFNTQIVSLLVSAPRAVSALEAVKNVPTFQARLKLRHPLAIFNVSIEQVVSRFSNALRAFKQLSLSYGNHEEDILKAKVEFLDSLDSLLDSLIEHIDDCNNVVRCFFESDSDPKYKNVYSQFKSSIRPYRNHVGRVVNKIKHEQGRLRLIHFSWPDGSSYGYFVEGANQEGAVGPDEDIHPGGNTAFSIARDFRFHLCGIYFVGTHLAQAVYEVCGMSIKQCDMGNQGSEGLAEIIQAVSSIPPIFFPDEIRKVIPTVKIVGGPGALIACGKLHHEKVSALPSAKVHVNFSGDGITRTFRVPYIGGHS